MKTKPFFQILLRSGLWMQPVALVSLVLVFREIAPEFLTSERSWKFCFLLSFLPIPLIWAKALETPKAQQALEGKKKAMHPEIPKELLFEEPTGILLGKDPRSKKFVCKPLREDGHVFLIGGSGSGKSSAFVIPTLLVNKEARIFAVDIKGELSFKTARYGSEKIRIFNPADRSQWGYHPFYCLSEASTKQQIYEAMKTIAFSLIPMPADLKDPFWKTSARQLLLGLLLYYYRKGERDFIGIIDEIKSRPVQESIADAMNTADPSSDEYHCFVQFEGLAEDTLTGIILEVSLHLEIFSNDEDIRYALRDSPCKLNPMNLEEGCSIYLSIREEKLSEYYDLLQLILNQTLSQLERRPEGSEPVLFIMDELPRILSAGKLDRLLDGARTLRSRNVCLFLISQSMEALMSAFKEHEVSDLISNCPYVIVLSASSSKTQKAVCAWCGKYTAKKTSWSGNGKDRKTTVSFEEKDLVEPSELMTLKNTGEAILVTPYGYLRVKKVPYYKDKFFQPIAEEIVKYNEIIIKKSASKKGHQTRKSKRRINNEEKKC